MLLSHICLKSAINFVSIGNSLNKFSNFSNGTAKFNISLKIRGLQVEGENFATQLNKQERVKEGETITS
jgi:hypothetical protein